VNAVISAIVLAAGMSRRMGRPKLLLPFGDGLVIQHVARTVAAAGVDETIVVIGHQRAEMEAALASLPVRAIFNPNYAQGEMLSSIQAGLRAASPAATAALIVLGDQPEITAAVLGQIIATLRHPGERICLPVYGGRRGHPIGLPRRFWPEVLALGPDASLRDVIRRHQAEIVEIAIANGAVLADMDTPEDYARALSRWQQCS
jgi:molybdenum cofactor cytidylyltransferase